MNRFREKSVEALCFVARRLNMLEAEQIQRLGICPIMGRLPNRYWEALGNATAVRRKVEEKNSSSTHEKIFQINRVKFPKICDYGLRR